MSPTDVLGWVELVTKIGLSIGKAVLAELAGGASPEEVMRKERRLDELLDGETRTHLARLHADAEARAKFGKLPGDP